MISASTTTSQLRSRRPPTSGLVTMLIALFHLTVAGAGQGVRVESEAEWKVARARFERDYSAPSEAKRLEAVKRLGGCDYRPAVEMLIQLIARPDPRIRALERELVDAQQEFESAYAAYLADAKRRGNGTVLATLGIAMEQAQARVADLRDRIFKINQVPATAEEALGRTTVEDGITEICKTASGHKAWQVRAACVRALGVIGGDLAESTTIGATADEVTMVRMAAATSLGALRVPDAVDELVRMLDDPAWQVRAAAVSSLRILRRREAVKPLIDHLAGEEGRLREDIDDALASLTKVELHGDHQQWLSWWEVRGEEFMNAPPEPEPEPEPEETAKAGDGEEGGASEDGAGDGEGTKGGGDEPGGEPPGDDAGAKDPGDDAGAKDPGDDAGAKDPGDDAGAKDPGDDAGEAAEEEGGEDEDALAEPDDPRTVTFYGIRTKSKRILFIVDISGSMRELAGRPAGKRRRGGVVTGGDQKGGNRMPVPELPENPTKLDVAKFELQSAVLRLEPDALFNILVYTDDCQLFRPKKMIPADDKSKKSVYQKIASLQPLAGTNIHDALDLGFKLAGRDTRKEKRPDEGIDTIFFLSDGQPTVGGMTDPEKIAEAVRGWNRTMGIKIHTIGVGKDHSRKFMERLATENGGKYVTHD